MPSCRYVQACCGQSGHDSEFLKAGDARAAIVQISASPDALYVAAVDAWGYVCVWDHVRVLNAHADGNGRGELVLLIARWKVNEGPVLDIQFTKQNGQTCILLLLPPVPPALSNTLLLFALDSSSGHGGGAVAQPLASWQQRATDDTDCLRFVDSSARATPAAPAPPVNQEGTDIEGRGGSEENDEDSVAAILASHINNALSVFLLASNSSLGCRISV